MDSIMAIFFGKESSTTTGNSDVYADAYDEAHRCLLEFVFSQFTRLQMASLLPFPFGCGWSTASNGIVQETIVRISDPGRRFRKAVATLDEESKRIIKERRLDPNLKSGTDLLALFMNAHDESAACKLTLTCGACGLQTLNEASANARGSSQGQVARGQKRGELLTVPSTPGTPCSMRRIRIPVQTRYAMR